MKIIFTVLRVAIPGVMLGPIIISAWIGGDLLAGDVIPISQESKIYLMFGCVVVSVGLLLYFLRYGLKYQKNEMIAVATVGALATTTAVIVLFTMILKNYL